MFEPPQESVSIRVQVSDYPGNYSLRIYNSAGELVRNLDHRTLTGPYQNDYSWNGKNDAGSYCASGVYVIYLIEPVKRRIARVLLVH
jgi:flagellar hook assembly protein FlgD